MALLLRIAASVAALLVIVGFFAFAADETGKASEDQIRKVERAMEAPTPTSSQESLREREHGPVREFIDDANDLLLSPFTGLIDSEDVWVQRLVPGALALLLYGLGGALLANALPKPKRDSRDWRTAT
jgi:hypothetical protein